MRPPGSAEVLRCRPWARLLRKTFEVESLLRPGCQAEGRTVEMEVVALIADIEMAATVVDRCSVWGAVYPHHPPRRRSDVRRDVNV